jgi:hypothetical protein
LRKGSVSEAAIRRPVVTTMASAGAPRLVRGVERRHDPRANRRPGAGGPEDLAIGRQRGASAHDETREVQVADGNRDELMVAVEIDPGLDGGSDEGGKGHGVQWISIIR